MAYRIEQTGVELQGILNDAAVTKQGLEDEVARAQAAEGVLQENIDSEAGERQSADALLAGNIGTEVARAQQAESDLGARVDANAAGVAAEVARAQEAEGEVWDTLNDEILTRQSQDAALQGNIEREAGLREAGDGQLQGEIYAISEKIPAEASEMNQLADKQYVQDAIGDAPTREEVAAIEAVIPAAASEDNKLVDTATFEAAIDGKQDTLTFDEEPTEGSENPVTSGGVASAVATLQGLYAELRDGKADKATTLAGYGIEDAYTKDAVDEMIGALSRNEIVVGPLPQAGEEGVIYRVPGNGYYTDYMYYDGEFVELSQYSMEFDQTQVGYFTCDTAAGTAAKTVSAAGYTLAVGGNMHIKMTNANTADGVTLNINGTGAKTLFYNGTQASADNSWADGEVLEVYYDGTRYQCSESPIDVKNGDNEHLIDFVDKDGYLIYYVDSDYRFHALGNDSDESDDGEMPSKGLVKALINDAISDIDIHSIDLDTMVGDNEHLVDFCDERGNLVFYVDSDFTFHALMSNISFHLPSVINTYIGDTLQLFYYPTFISQEYRDVGVNMFVQGEALNGKSLARYSEYTPATAGTKTMKCTALDSNLGILSQKTVSVNVATPASPSTMKNILLIGDSETEGYVNNSRVSPSADGQTTSMRYPYGRELQRLLTSDDAATDTSPAGLGLSNIQLIGHLHSDVRHEGYGGRSTSWFMGSSSPFYINGAIDFNAYLSQDSMYSDTSHKGVDYIYILLGANDGVTVSMIGGKLVLDASTYKTGMVALLDKIKSQIINGSGTYSNPNLKVILLSYTLSNPTGGAYHILGQGEFDNGMKQALSYYQYKLVNDELAAMSDYSSFVESVFVSPQIDSEYAYAYINKQVNSYSDETEKVYVENIHPNTIGYKMYGHAVARDILSRI